MEALSTEAVKVLHLLGNEEVTHVDTTVGSEQEYFLIDKDMYLKRKDLLLTGRTLIGAPAPKGQEMEDHYFGVLKPKVSEYMHDLDQELWKLGVPAKTKHNEVAPSQHAFCMRSRLTESTAPASTTTGRSSLIPARTFWIPAKHLLRTFSSWSSCWQRSQQWMSMQT